MDPNYLLNDEFVLECTVRGIKSDNPLTNLNELLKRLEDEKTHPVLVPNRPLPTVQKNPKREVHNISLKLQEIYADIKKTLKNKNQTEVQGFQSRLLHISARLYRISYSKVVFTAVTKLQDKCKQLCEFVDNYDTTKDDLDKSTKLLETIQLQNVVEVREDAAPSSDSEHSSCESGESQIMVQNPTLIKPKAANTDMKAGPSNRELNRQQSKIDKPKQPDPHSNVGKRNVVKPVDANASTPSGVGSQLLPNVSSENSDSENNASTTHPSVGKRTSRRFQRDPSKWPYSFDGSAGGMPAKTFIRMVEHLAKSNGIHLQQMANDMGFLLRNKAQDWYCMFVQRHGIFEWQFFRDEFIKRFSDRRTDLEIRKMMEAKKQRFNERFQDFYDSILSLSLQMEYPLPDSELIFVITQNMRPGLQDRLAITKIECIDELVRHCIAYEDAWNRNRIAPELFCESRKFLHELSVPSEINNAINQKTDNFNEAYPMQSSLEQQNNPDRSQGISQQLNQYIPFDLTNNNMNNNYQIGTNPYLHNALVKPELYYDTYQNTAGVNPMVNALSTNQVGHSNHPSPPLKNREPNITKYCWNCNSAGHYFKNCGHEVLHMFCFGCGTPGVIKTHCPTCRQIWGNGKRGVNVPKMLTPNQMVEPAPPNPQSGFRAMLKRP